MYKGCLLNNFRWQAVDSSFWAYIQVLKNESHSMITWTTTKWNFSPVVFPGMRKAPRMLKNKVGHATVTVSMCKTTSCARLMMRRVCFCWRFIYQQRSILYTTLNWFRSYLTASVYKARFIDGLSLTVSEGHKPVCICWKRVTYQLTLNMWSPTEIRSLAPDAPLLQGTTRKHCAGTWVLFPSIRWRHADLLQF